MQFRVLIQGLWSRVLSTVGFFWVMIFLKQVLSVKGQPQFPLCVFPERTKWLPVMRLRVLMLGLWCRVPSAVRFFQTMLLLQQVLIVKSSLHFHLVDLYYQRGSQWNNWEQCWPTIVWENAWCSPSKPCSKEAQWSLQTRKGVYELSFYWSYLVKLYINISYDYYYLEDYTIKR